MDMWESILHPLLSMVEDVWVISTLKNKKILSAPHYE